MGQRSGLATEPRVLLKDSFFFFNLGCHPVMDEIVGAFPLKAQHWIPYHNFSAQGREKRLSFALTIKSNMMKTLLKM